MQTQISQNAIKNAASRQKILLPTNYYKKYCTLDISHSQISYKPTKIANLFFTSSYFSLTKVKVNKSLDFYDFCLTVDEIRAGNTFTFGN